MHDVAGGDSDDDHGGTKAEKGMLVEKEDVGKEKM